MMLLGTLSVCVLLFFFFKQKTAYEMRISDWSSDVCSSDLLRLAGPPAPGVEALGADASVLEEALNLLGSGGLAAKPCRQRGPLSRTLAFTAFFAARPRSRSSALLRNRQIGRAHV